MAFETVYVPGRRTIESGAEALTKALLIASCIPLVVVPGVNAPKS